MMSEEEKININFKESFLWQNFYSGHSYKSFAVQSLNRKQVFVVVSLENSRFVKKQNNSRSLT